MLTAQPQNTRKSKHHHTFFDQTKVIELINEWRDQKSIGGAADILNFAHIPDSLPLLIEPAEYLASLHESIPPILKRISLRILEGQGFSEDVAQPISTLCPREWHYLQASRLKKNISTNPRDAVALVDLARIYAALNQREKAKKAILTALSLYPNHQFILRSAARFFIQVGEAEQALHFLNSSSRTLYDPWLLASKLSIEEILGKHHKHLGKARSIAESDAFAPFQLSELRGTLASIQLTDGNIKQAKKIFNKALINPNDNVVAQAMWASQQYDVSFSIRSELFNNPLSSEAMFYQRFLESDYESSKNAAISWFIDEPISSRPLRAVTFVTAILGEAELSEKYALEGLLLDKDNIELNNNLVCAFAAQNKIDEAFKQLQQVILLERSQSMETGGHTFANFGMILYRKLCFKEGEEFYRKAITIFDKKNSNETKGIVVAFMAHEAVLADAPNAQDLLTEAIDKVAKHKSKAGEKILSLIDKSSPKKIGRSSSLGRGKQWIYDKDHNILTFKNVKTL